jgi:hypothetical protein
MQIFRIFISCMEVEDLYKVEIEVITSQEVITGTRVTWRRSIHKSIFTSPISPHSNLKSPKLANSN